MRLTYKLRRVVKDQFLADLDTLPAPNILAGEIVENLESALGSVREVLRMLKK